MQWMDGENNLLLTCQRASSEMVLLRCETRDPVVRLPETINGQAVTALGDYAMARRTPDLSLLSDQFIVRIGNGESSHDAEHIRRIILPRSMRSVGDYAFYDCHSLEYLDAGPELTEIGSGAFLNCNAFHCLESDVSADGTSCLRGILREHHGELLCTLRFQNGDIARLWFPAYSEEYEELAAPHIFGYHIEGAGFTYRQCFDGKRLNFSQYDAALDRLILTQDFSSAARVAIARLRWPRDLSPSSRARYEEILANHADEALKILLSEKDSESLAFFLRMKLFSADSLEAACNSARTNRNTEMLGLLMEHLHRAGTVRAKTFDL